MSGFVEQTLVDFLFRFPLVKEFFLKFRSDEWPSVLSSTLLYGIQSLDFMNNKRATVADIEEKVRKTQNFKQVEDYIPGLKQKLGCLKKEIAELEDRLVYRPESVRSTEESHEEVPALSQNRPKMVDFWYQTDLRKKSSRKESKRSPQNKAWAGDFTRVIKNQRSSLNYEDLDT
jgi:hypothetical protein